MSGQTAIAAVKQFAAHGAGSSKVSFVKELSIGMVLGLGAGMLWKVILPPSPLLFSPRLTSGREFCFFPGTKILRPAKLLQRQPHLLAPVASDQTPDSRDHADNHMRHTTHRQYRCTLNC